VCSFESRRRGFDHTKGRDADRDDGPDEDEQRREVRKERSRMSSDAAGARRRTDLRARHLLLRAGAHGGDLAGALPRRTRRRGSVLRP
jgi:hypothetical protein